VITAERTVNANGEPVCIVVNRAVKSKSCGIQSVSYEGIIRRRNQSECFCDCWMDLFGAVYDIKALEFSSPGGKPTKHSCPGFIVYAFIFIICVVGVVRQNKTVPSYPRIHTPPFVMAEKKSLVVP